MRTALISDLHLGSRSGSSLLADEQLRARLLDAVERCDRLVLLGDVVELRDRPVAEALAAARPFFEAVGAALPGVELVVVPGNHDYQLDPWIRGRRTAPRPRPVLALEQRRAPTPGGPLAELAAACPDNPVELAYPGLWVRDDVYATHGHYLDVHASVPTFENVGASAVARSLGLRDGPSAADGYEDVLAPIYAFAYALAQGETEVGPRASARLFERIASSPTRGLLFGAVALPAVIATINRAGLGPFSADLRAEALSRSGVRAMAAAVDRLGIEARWVVFGHTHRAGPLDTDAEPWHRSEAPSLVNCGCWVRESGAFGTPDSPRSPWYPGGMVVVEESGPPALRRLLEGGLPEADGATG